MLEAKKIISSECETEDVFKFGPMFTDRWARKMEAKTSEIEIKFLAFCC